jgi:hypothetical protein
MLGNFPLAVHDGEERSLPDFGGGAGEVAHASRSYCERHERCDLLPAEAQKATPSGSKCDVPAAPVFAGPS